MQTFKEKAETFASKLDMIVDTICQSPELDTTDVRPHICGGWFCDDESLEVYVYHRCDFFEVRLTKHKPDNFHKEVLGNYILLTWASEHDSHVCFYNDGTKDVFIGYNAYKDEIVISPLGLSFRRTTIKTIDRSNERMKLNPELREMAMDKEDQIFIKGYVDCDCELDSPQHEMETELVNILKEMNETTTDKAPDRSGSENIESSSEESIK